MAEKGGARFAADTVISASDKVLEKIAEPLIAARTARLGRAALAWLLEKVDARSSPRPPVEERAPAGARVGARPAGGGGGAPAVIPGGGREELTRVPGPRGATRDRDSTSSSRTARRHRGSARSPGSRAARRRRRATTLSPRPGSGVWRSRRRSRSSRRSAWGKERKPMSDTLPPGASGGGEPAPASSPEPTPEPVAAPSKPTWKRRWSRRVLVTCGILFMLVVGIRIAVWIALPMVIRQAARTYDLEADWEELNLTVLGADAELWHLHIQAQGWRRRSSSTRSTAAPTSCSGSSSGGRSWSAVSRRTEWMST